MIGFIGYGNMGGALVRAFLSHGVPANEIAISTRTTEKLNPLLSEYDICISDLNQIQNVDILFLCVRSSDALSVLKQLTSFKGHLVSINGGISLDELTSIYSGPVTKLMPSLTVEVGRGIALLCHAFESKSSKDVESLLSSVSNVKLIPEHQFPAAENITGCSPAFFALFAELLAHNSSLPLEDALDMSKETLIATAMLLDKRGLSLSDVIREVATEGGITEKGLSVMNEESPSVILKMFERMHQDP